MGFDFKKCLICKRPNDTLYFHKKEKNILVYCSGKCQRSYTLSDYCLYSGLTLSQFLKHSDLSFAKEETKGELNAIKFPNYLISMGSNEASAGREYLHKRGLDVFGNWFYDAMNKGIFFPYYYRSTFVGGQTRIINPTGPKVITITGTRNSLLFFNWDQTMLVGKTNVVVCEGAFNCLSIEKALSMTEVGKTTLCVALSGSGVSDHQADVLHQVLKAGCKVTWASDFDEAGKKMLKKAIQKGVVSRFVFPVEGDWNDVLIKQGAYNLCQMFLEGVVDV